MTAKAVLELLWRIHCWYVLVFSRIIRSQFRSVLPIYEYIITSEREISIVWQHRMTCMSILLITTRWVMVLNSIFTVLTPTSAQVCADTTHAISLSIHHSY